MGLCQFGCGAGRLKARGSPWVLDLAEAQPLCDSVVESALYSSMVNAKLDAAW